MPRPPPGENAKATEAAAIFRARDKSRPHSHGRGRSSERPQLGPPPTAQDRRNRFSGGLQQDAEAGALAR
eukprot:9129461-Pyramimonas_sp.AAC.1